MLSNFQLVDISKSRRLGGRLLPRVRPSPSVSSSSVLPRDNSAVASVSLSPETAADTRETGIVVAEASFDLASLVAAHKTGTHTQSLELPLTKTSGHFVISFSCTKLEGLIAAEASPIPQPAAGAKRSLTPAAAAALLAGVEACQPTVLRLPHKDTLPSSLEMPTFEETAPKQQQQAAAATPAFNDGAAKTPSIEKIQRPLQEVVSTGTATTPAELSPAESQRQQRQQTQQSQQQQQQQQVELRQKDELIASLQRQVALMEAEDRQMTNPQLAQLFAQIDELHTALAAAQEQQLAAAEQLQKVREKGDGSAGAAALQQQLHAAEQRLQQQEQQTRELTLQQQEMQQKSCEQQQQLLQLQAERDGMQLIADAYKKQLEEVHKQLQHQPPHMLQEERMVILLQQVKQQEQEIQQLQNKLDYETREKNTAQNEVRLLQKQLHEQQQLHQTKGNSDSASILQEQIISLQRQVVEASEMRESLRVSKDQTIGDLRKALQEMQQKQGETQSVHQQALQKLNASREEAEALREKVRCQEETLQRLPTQAAWSCAQQQHQMLLQQQREWQQQQQQQQRQQEFELAAKAKRIEELEKELVHAKVELAAAEQRRHEDIDAFKKKLQAVKETVVAYAAASSSSLQV
ncbi:pseudouridylate synthase 1, putative [Eimeria necatrix]|uniref:Pseudouridylate synthase 1, putative n=1 Tax=Eimeria necatrix TaxID=51315 RepID=U6MTE3_9EIME|nr:pseudouridylate synthase 1, putative [Eimeria necatrix]CDJ66358.1 pseudouridylate synthase 1, putative [Eimeria necatrix]